MKNIRIFYLKIFIFLVKFSVYLNRHVFVMRRLTCTESSLSAWGCFGSLTTHRVLCKDSDQPAQMRRLIWVFAEHICSYEGGPFYAPPLKKWWGIMLYPLKFWVSVRPSVGAPTIRLPATPPTVLGQSFPNFTGAFRMVWRYAYCFFRILKLFFITFFSFLT